MPAEISESTQVILNLGTIGTVVITAIFVGRIWEKNIQLKKDVNAAHNKIRIIEDFLWPKNPKSSSKD